MTLGFMKAGQSCREPLPSFYVVQKEKSKLKLTNSGLLGTKLT